MVEVVGRGLGERIHASETVMEEVGGVDVEVLSVVVEGEETPLVSLFVLRLRQRRRCIGRRGGGGGGAGVDVDVLHGGGGSSGGSLLVVRLDDDVVVVAVIIVVDVEMVVIVVDEVVERVFVEFLVLGHVLREAIDSGLGLLGCRMP